MSNTPKIKRTWVKEEKTIVKLLYRKGLLKDFKLDDLYWAEYYWSNKKKYKTKDGKYRFPVYLPEVHYCTTDYWGESDEHSVVRHAIEHLYWENIDTKNWDSKSDEYPPSKLPKMGRKKFIQYLKKLPTEVNNNKIRKVLRHKIDN